MQCAAQNSASFAGTLAKSLVPAQLGFSTSQCDKRNRASFAFIADCCTISAGDTVAVKGLIGRDL